MSLELELVVEVLRTSPSAATCESPQILARICTRAAHLQTRSWLGKLTGHCRVAHSLHRSALYTSSVHFKLCTKSLDHRLKR